jgi:hypothetical protein
MGADLETAKRQTLDLKRLSRACSIAGNSWRQSYEKILVSSFVDYAGADGS